MSTILYFSPTPSHPQSAGNRSRIYNLAKALQESGHKIIFVYYTQEGLTKQQHKEMREMWDELYIFEKTIHPRVRVEGYYFIDDWYQEGLGEEIAQIALKHKIDTILCSYVFQSKILDFLPDTITKIIDTHDKFSNRHLMLQEEGLTPDFFYTVPKQETIALNRADKVIAIQEKEAEFFRSITKTQIATLGHIQAQNFLDTKREEQKLVVGFVGSANSVNIRSLERFLELYKKSDLDKQLTLRIAGSICKKVTVKDPNIELLGFVESLDNFYKEVDLIINPLILGTGLKIKTIEALSYGKAIVSTAIGFEGIASLSPLHHLAELSLMLQELRTLADNRDEVKKLEELSRTIYTDIIAKERENIEEIFTPIKKEPLLIVTHIDFWNQDLGSKNRLFDMVQYLLKSEELLVVYINPKRKNDQKVINKHNLAKNVIFLQDIEEIEGIELKALHSFIEKHPVLQSFVDEKNYKKLATFLQSYSFKKVIIEYIHLSYFLPLFPKQQSYLDTHDIMFKRYETFKKNKQKHWIEISQAEEFALFKEYDYVLSIQKHEHMFLKEHNINSLLVPYSFKISQTQKKQSKKAIIFIGGNTLANQDAINWFLKNIWDLFVPCDYALEIYGDICHSVQANNKKKIFTKGRIENLDTLYAYKDLIAINPVNIGGGLKIKNVEALCSGLALLTSWQGAFGLEDGINEAFLVADSVDDFKNKLLALMLSKKLRDKLSYNAVQYAKENFHSDVCYAELARLIRSDEDTIDE